MEKSNEPPRAALRALFFSESLRSIPCAASSIHTVVAGAHRVLFSSAHTTTEFSPLPRLRMVPLGMMGGQMVRLKRESVELQLQALMR